MIIVVEGPDSSGKTVLAQNLARLLPSLYLKSFLVPVPQATALVAYISVLTRADMFAPFVISDRHPAISERIYGTILRGGHKLDPMDIEEGIARVHAFIYCRPPLELMHKTIDDKPQMAGVKENLDKITQFYDQTFDDIHLDQVVYVYNYTKNNPQELAHDLITHAREYKV